MTIQRQFPEFAGVDYPFRNFHASTDIAAGILVSVDETNDIDVSTDVQGLAIKLPGAEGDPVVGCTMEIAVHGGNHARVRVFGIVECTASGTVTAGNTVMATTAGKAKASTTGKAAAGIALTTAADTEKVLVLLRPDNYNA